MARFEVLADFIKNNFDTKEDKEIADFLRGKIIGGEANYLGGANFEQRANFTFGEFQLADFSKANFRGKTWFTGTILSNKSNENTKGREVGNYFPVSASPSLSSCKFSAGFILDRIGS